MKRFLKNISIIEIVFLVVVVIAVVMTISSAAVDYKVIRTNDSSTAITVEPDEITYGEDGSADFVFTSVEWRDGFNALMFYGNHQDITVYADGNQIFERSRLNSIFGHTTGSTWNFLTIPIGAELVDVHTSPAYSAVANPTIEFTLGNGYELMLSKMQDSAMGGVVCVLILLVGLCLIIYWVLSFRSSKELRELLYLGLFSFFLGVWAFGETDIAQILMTNRIMGSFMAFSCLYLLGPSTILYAHYFMRMPDKIMFRILAGYGLVVGVVTTLLQVLHVLDFKQMAPLIQSIIPVSFIYWIGGVIVCFKRKIEVKRAIVNVVGMGILLIAVLIDLIAYYTDRSSANRSGKFGFLIYVIMLGIMTANSTREKLADRRQLELYRELATKDMLTSCFNRNAYDTDWQQIANPENWFVVTFDLNNLKECNDTLGHAAGDEYLQGAAKTIRQIFGRYGKCYRIGGDEFVVLMQKPKKASVADLVQRAFALEKYKASEGPVYGLGFAVGYAMFDANEDANLEDTRIRADEKMYANKREIKDAAVG